MVHPNAIKLLIPKKSTKKVVVEKFINIRVTSSGKYIVNNKSVNQSNLNGQLARTFVQADKSIIKLRTDKNASTGDVARILDIAETNGVKVILDIR